MQNMVRCNRVAKCMFQCSWFVSAKFCFSFFLPYPFTFFFKHLISVSSLASGNNTLGI